MFIRKKVNKSGSVSIHVIDKSDGKFRVHRSFGAAHTQEEVTRLEEDARSYIRSLHGEELDLFASSQDTRLMDFLATLSNSQFQVIGPELIYGALYDRIGYGRIGNDMFRHLVITRLFNPGSKLKTICYLRRYLGIIYSEDQIYRFLDNLCHRKGRVEGRRDIKSQVEQIAFEHTKAVVGGRINVVFYDMTTLYFEASDEDDLRIAGFSKDGKHSNPQIFLGLLVASGGNPIGYEIFEGNIFEGHTLIPVLEKMTERFGLGRPVVVADAGLLSKSNIRALQENGYRYILGARPKNESKAIQEAILSRTLQDGEIAVLQRDADSRLIVSHTESRARKDASNRLKGLKRLQKRLGSGRLTKSNINNRGYNKYLRMDGDIAISIDMEKFEADGAWDGIKAYVTNTDLSEKDVISSYSHLWYIERAFRMNKTDLKIRPIYHRIRNRIEGHICICFTAYSIMLELERLLERSGSVLSIEACRELTNSMYQITVVLPDSGKQVTQLLRMDDLQQQLYKIISESS